MNGYEYVGARPTGPLWNAASVKLITIGTASGRGAMAHGERLAPSIAEALAQAGASVRDVTDVAVGVGPGPFTGLRVGVVTALTLGATGGIRAHGVCSLDVLAAEVASDGPFIVATDARRKEVYWALYDGGRRAARNGAIPAGDMTAESAVVKLMAALGRSRKPADVRRAFDADWAGERTR